MHFTGPWFVGTQEPWLSFPAVLLHPAREVWLLELNQQSGRATRSFGVTSAGQMPMAFVVSAGPQAEHLTLRGRETLLRPPEVGGLGCTERSG